MTLALYPAAVRGLAWPSPKAHEFNTTIQQAPNFYTTRILNSQNPIWHWQLTYNYLKDNPQDLVSSLGGYTDYRYLEGFLLSNQGQYNEFLFDDIYDNALGAHSQAGGPSSFPAIFQVSSYPQQEFYYPLGSYVVDNNSTPHLQLVTQSGVGGSTVPTFSTVGGSVTSGSARFTDQGVFPGSRAQALDLVTDGAFYYSPIQRNFGGQFLEDVTDLNTTAYGLKIWANGVLKSSGSDYTLLGPGLAVPGASYEGMYVKWIGSPLMPVAPITALAQFYFRVRIESDSYEIAQFMQSFWSGGGPEQGDILKLVSSRAALV